MHFLFFSLLWGVDSKDTLFCSVEYLLNSDFVAKCQLKKIGLSLKRLKSKTKQIHAKKQHKEPDVQVSDTTRPP
jgi:hypothetical protein